MTTDAPKTSPTFGWIAGSLCVGMSWALIVHLLIQVIPWQAAVMEDFGMDASTLGLPFFGFLLHLSSLIPYPVGLIPHPDCIVLGYWLVISGGFAFLSYSSCRVKNGIALWACGIFEVASVAAACLLALSAMWTSEAIVLQLAFANMAKVNAM